MQHEVNIKQRQVSAARFWGDMALLYSLENNYLMQSTWQPMGTFPTFCPSSTYYTQRDCLRIQIKRGKAVLLLWHSTCYSQLETSKNVIVFWPCDIYVYWSIACSYTFPSTKKVLRKKVLLTHMARGNCNRQVIHKSKKKSSKLIQKHT